MYQDEIIAEAWKNREAYANRHNHDLHAIVADLQKRQQHPFSQLVDRRQQARDAPPPSGKEGPHRS